MTPQNQAIAQPATESLNTTLARNIDSLRRRQADQERASGFHERLAELITRFSGSIGFVYVHLVIVGFWIAANLRWVGGVEPWDPTFVILAMVASVEAIFLSTFVLISQNRMAAENDRRDELNLQISLLAEHEVTRLIQLTSAIAEHIGIEPEGELDELKRDIAPEAVLDAIEEGEE